MATSVLKVALMVFFVLIICAIILVPIALMLTLEDKEEQNSTVPLSNLTTTTEEPMAKTASPTTTATSEPPPILGGGGAGLLVIQGGGGLEVPPMLGGGGTGLPPMLGGDSAELPPMHELFTEPVPNNYSELQCSDIFESESWKSSPPMLPQYSFCHPDYIGDSYCDGPCNIAEHNYDEGDCCSPFVTFHYCNYDDCECYCYPEDQQYVNTNNGLPTIMPPTAISFTF